MLALPMVARRPAKSLSCALALALVLASGVALFVSADGAQAQQASPTAIATAKELLKVKGADTTWPPLVRGVVERAKLVFLQSNPTLGKDLNEVAAKLTTDFYPRSSELLNDIAKLYATHFTEQELKDALAFYKSPLGHKLLTEEPKVLEQSLKDAQSFADKLSDEVIGKMRAEMRKRGHEI
jgi:uncharacterized protein